MYVARPSMGEILEAKYGTEWSIVPQPKQNEYLNQYFHQYVLPQHIINKENT